MFWLLFLVAAKRNVLAPKSQPTIVTETTKDGKVVEEKYKPPLVIDTTTVKQFPAVDIIVAKQSPIIVKITTTDSNGEHLTSSAKKNPVYDRFTNKPLQQKSASCSELPESEAVQRISHIQSDNIGDIESNSRPTSEVDLLDPLDPSEEYSIYANVPDSALSNHNLSLEFSSGSDDEIDENISMPGSHEVRF